MNGLAESVKDLLNNLPHHIDKNFIAKALDLAQRNCTDNTEISYLLSRLNNLKKQKYEYSAVMAFFSEIVFLTILNDKLKDIGTISFAKENQNDLKLVLDPSIKVLPIRIEVKTIMDLDSGLKHQEFLDKLRTIPSGKSYDIEYDVDFPESFDKKAKQELMDNVYNKILSTVSNDLELSGKGKNKILVKDLKRKVNSSVTAFRGPTHAYWVNEEHLTKVIERKIGNDGILNKQIAMTDIVAFNVIDLKFDDEDIIDTLNELSLRYDFRNKLIIFLTRWQGGKLVVFNSKDVINNENLSQCAKILQQPNENNTQR